MKFINKKDKQLLSEAEIQQQMNFDKFISAHVPPVKGWLSGGAKLYTFIASVSAVLITTAYLVYHSSENQQAVNNPFVLPPIMAMDIPSDTFVLNNEKDSIVLFSTGTFITVPSGAFVDADGKDVKGEVQIHYREFHDPIDILLSGIPMNYDSAGIQYQLESAGMFEITATKDGMPLSLKPGKSVLVNMISHTPDPTGYNIYNLDTINRKWNYISENTAANNTCIKAFEDRLPQSDTDEEFITEKKPVSPEKANTNADNFVIDFNKDEFPELAVFSGLKFEPLKGERKYNAALSKKVWEDVLIERHRDDKHYIITFSAGKESHRFTVTPVVDEKNYAAAMKEFSVRQKEYELALSEKKRNAVRKNDSLYELNSRFKNLALKSNNMNERFNNFIDNSYMETSQDLLAYRTFSISRLGTWNSDRPFPFFANEFKSMSGDYAAQFVSENDQPIDLVNVYLIRRSVNSIFSIPQSRFDHFPFYKDGADVMVGLTDDNRLVYIKDQELRSTEVKGKIVRFKMNKAPAGIVKAEQLKDLLKL